MKIQLLAPMAGWKDGMLVVYDAGDILDVTEAEANAMIADGSAVAVPDEPKRSARKAT